MDEAVNYIKSLQANLEKLKEKKESLMGSQKRPQTSSTSNAEASTTSLRSPIMEIRDMGSNLQVTLVTGPEDRRIFYDIIGILHEESAEVLSASFSVIGDSVFHVILAQVPLLAHNLDEFCCFFFLEKIGLSLDGKCELCFWVSFFFWADWGFHLQFRNKVDM